MDRLAVPLLLLLSVLLAACSPLGYSEGDRLVSLHDSRLAHDKLLLAPGWAMARREEVRQGPQSVSLMIFTGAKDGERLAVLHEPLPVDAEPASGGWLDWSLCEDRAFCDSVYTFFDERSCELVAYYMVPARDGRYVVSYGRSLGGESVPCDAWRDREFFSEAQEEIYRAFFDHADRAFRPVAR